MIPTPTNPIIVCSISPTTVQILYIKKWTAREELFLKESHEQVESLRIRIRDEATKWFVSTIGHLIKRTLLMKPLSPATGGITLPSACPAGGDFNPPNTCWKSSTASCRQSRRLLECIENFFTQVMDSLTC